jgi:cell division transport system permease protein
MTILFFKRAIEDFRNNRLLNVVTLLTVSLSILIVSAFILFFNNTNEIMKFWKKGLRIMAYLKADIPSAEMSGLRHQLQTMSGVEKVTFISKEEALKQLKAQMKSIIIFTSGMDITRKAISHSVVLTTGVD